MYEVVLVDKEVMAHIYRSLDGHASSEELKAALKAMITEPMLLSAPTPARLGREIMVLSKDNVIFDVKEALEIFEVLMHSVLRIFPTKEGQLSLLDELITLALGTDHMRHMAVTFQVIKELVASKMSPAMTVSEQVSAVPFGGCGACNGRCRAHA